MKTNFFSPPIVWLFAVVGFTTAAAAQPAAHDVKVFRAGAATSNITPPIGGLIIGGPIPPASTHIHDEMHVRCLALDDGASRLVFAVVDSVSVPREVFDQAKRLIHEATGVPIEQMMMSATHTHSSTSARGAESPFKFSKLDYEADPELAVRLRGAAEAVSGISPDDYQSFLVRRIADGVRRAIHNLEPARIGWGTGRVPQHVFNRRWLLRDGKTVVNPFGGQDRAVMLMRPRSPPELPLALLEPAGPVNPEVFILSVQSLRGRPIALLANYWLHYVDGAPRGHISANYFGVFCERIGQLLGADRQDPAFVGILANGPCADVLSFNQDAPRKYAPYERIRLVAEDVAQEALRVQGTIQHREWVELKAAKTELELNTRRPTPEQHELGGYETWLGINKVEQEASRKIVAKLLELFAQLR